VRCEGCGAEAPVLKTVKWRGGERHFALCDPCWEPIASGLWVVPGRVPAHGYCPSCSGWFPVGELSELRPAGYKWDAPSGLCQNCAKDRAG
jgi:hypothetical protein